MVRLSRPVNSGRIQLLPRGVRDGTTRSPVSLPSKEGRTELSEGWMPLATKICCNVSRKIGADTWDP